MKLDVKTLIIIVLSMILIAIAAYWLGTRQQVLTPQYSALPPVNDARNGTQIPQGHPGVMPRPAMANRLNTRFTHFRVGNKNVKGMLADGNNVWVGTSGGVLRYDIKTDNYELFDVAGGQLISNGVFHLSRWKQNIVVGTYGGGLSLFNTATGKWRNYNIPQGLADQFVYDFQQVSNGDVWIATWSGANRVIGGELDNPAKWQTFNVENTAGGLPNDWVYGFEESADGSLWFATEKGVARYKDGKWKNWQHKDGLGAPLELVKDDIRFNNDPGKASQHHARQKTEQGLQDVNIAYNPNYVVSLKIGPKGKIWAGTWGGGLSYFDGEKWTTLTTRDGLPSNHIFMLYLDPQNQLWAGTSHGLVKIEQDGKRLTQVGRGEGLFAENVFSMAQAEDNTYWVGSFGGVARISGL